MRYLLQKKQIIVQFYYSIIQLFYYYKQLYYFYYFNAMTRTIEFVHVEININFRLDRNSILSICLSQLSFKLQ